MSDISGTVTDIIKDFFEESKVRTKSRAIGALFLSWLSVNYTNVATLLFTNKRTPELVSDTVSKMLHPGFFGWCWMALIWSFWVFARPLADHFVSIALHKIEKPWRKLQEANLDENLRYRKLLREKELIDSESKSKVEEQERQIANLKSELDRYRYHKSASSYMNSQSSHTEALRSLLDWIKADLQTKAFDNSERLNTDALCKEIESEINRFSDTIQKKLELITSASSAILKAPDSHSPLSMTPKMQIEVDTFSEYLKDNLKVVESVKLSV